MTRYGRFTGETEVLCNFAVTWTRPTGQGFIFDEIQHILLSFGNFFNTVQMDSSFLVSST